MTDFFFHKSRNSKLKRSKRRVDFLACKRSRVCSKAAPCCSLSCLGAIPCSNVRFHLDSFLDSRYSVPSISSPFLKLMISPPWASQLLPSLLAIKANQVPNLPPNKKMTLRFYVLSCFLLTALFPSVQTSLPMASFCWCDGATTPVVMCNQLAVAWPRSSPWLSQLPTCRFSEPPHVILPSFLRMRLVIENKGPVFHKSSTSNQASKCHIQQLQYVLYVDIIDLCYVTINNTPWSNAASSCETAPKLQTTMVV